MDLIYLIFYACGRLLFPDVETNPSPWSPVPDVCIILSCNILDLSWNLSKVIVASSQYTMYCCALRLLSRIYATRI